MKKRQQFASSAKQHYFLILFLLLQLEYTNKN